MSAGLPRPVHTSEAVVGDWMTRLADLSPVGIYRCDPQGQCVYVNRRWCELTGLSVVEALGNGWETAIHSDDRARIRDEWRRTTAEGAPFRSTYRFLRPDGKVHWIFGQVIEDRGEDGTLSGLIGTVTDVTECCGRGVWPGEAHGMAMVVDKMEDAVVLSDKEGRIFGWNEAAERLFGFAKEEVLGKTTLLLTPEDQKTEALEIKRKARGGESVRVTDAWRLNKKGERIPVDLSVFPLSLSQSEEGVVGTAAIVRDLRVVRKIERKIGRLSQQLLRAESDERRRIARELHDSTAQLLAAASINLSQLCGASSGAALTEQHREQLLAESAVFAERALMEVRTQSYLLHPPLIDERGLIAALKFFVEGFSNRSGIQVEFNVSSHFSRVPEVVRFTLFRVVQEALTNVHRHSESPRAEISLTRNDGWIELAVRDFGVGLNDGVNQLSGVGLAGMRERVSLIGGTFYLDNVSPGTRIVVRIREALT